MVARLGNVWWAFVRFAFRLLYHEMSWTYDWVSWTVSLGHWRTWQRAVIPYVTTPSSQLTLELAHGTGDLQLDFGFNRINSIGLDLSQSMGNTARRKLRQQSITMQLVRGRAMHLPFSSNQFGYVVSTFPTEFIVQHATITEIIRILKPGGRFIIVPNAMLTVPNPVTWAIDKLYKVTGQRGLWVDHFIRAFEGCGLIVSIHRNLAGSSIVWVVQCIKPVGEGRVSD